MQFLRCPNEGNILMKKMVEVSVSLVGVCLLLAVSLPAQAQNWAHTWGGSQNDSANAVTTDANGNVYALGSTNSFGAGEYGFLPPGAALSSSGGSVGKMYTFHVIE